jgi:hypothetical protein
MHELDPLTELSTGLERFVGASPAEAIAAVERISAFYAWPVAQLRDDVTALARRVGLNPPSLVWWLYGSIDLMKTAETRKLVGIVAGLATICERMNLFPDG